jgi:pyrroline-5-carboxylate reductase
LEETVVGFIGAGNMAGSIIRGLIDAGKKPQSIFVADIDDEKLHSITTETSVNSAATQKIPSLVDVLILAVKPQVMKSVCQELINVDTVQLVISVAAGIKITQMEQWLNSEAAIVRCMPNTPALVGEGATGLFANKLVSDHQKNLAQSIMDSVGLTSWMENERDMDTVTAISGSGPAYFFLLMEAMQEVAQELGLEKDVAENLICQTAIGASKLIQESDDSGLILRKKVTSPGGTTERAISVFESGNIRGLVRDALIAARDRSIELSEDFSN